MAKWKKKEVMWHIELEKGNKKKIAKEKLAV